MSRKLVAAALMLVSSVAGSAITRAMGTLDPPEFFGKKPRLALIAGPTASGKSDYALDYAEALQAQGVHSRIVNADSAQVYRDLKVLSARPDESEMRGIEHRLYGAWDGANPCSAADWAQAARREITAAHDAGVVPILVGGTGLYLSTLLDGIAPIPAIDPAIREQVRNLPQSEARLALEEEDPVAAGCLAPADKSRTTRALEVVRSTGTPIGVWRAQRTGGILAEVSLDARVLLPDRDWLYTRCDRRFAWMLDHGAIAEVEALLARELACDLPVMRAIGVREITSFLRHETDRETMIESGSRATRQYAKRQYTWFKNQSGAGWQMILDRAP